MFTVKNIATAFFEKAPGIIAELNTQLPESDRRDGGYFCIQRTTEELPDVIIKIGQPTAEKGIKSLLFCQEKAGRLRSNPDHVSSWQSRKPDDAQYGGAIKIGDDFIVALSGLIESADEAVLVIFAYRLQLINWKEAEAIAEASENRLIRLNGHAVLPPVEVAHAQVG